MTAPPLNDTVTAQAAQWLAVMLEGSERRIEFLGWLAESPRHVEEFLEVANDAQEIMDLTPERRARIADLAPDTDFGIDGNVVPLRGAIHRIERAFGIDRDERMAAHPSPEDEGSVASTTGYRGPRASSRMVASFAALLVVLAGLAAWLNSPWSWTTYTTRIGEQRTIELTDGSIVHLNTDSRIAVRMLAGSRVVDLRRGEALFDVRHDAKRPFLVEAANTVVQAIGTRFDVYSRGDGGARVAVIEGLVQVSAASTASSTSEASPPLAPTVAGGDKAARGEASLTGVRQLFLAAGEMAEIKEGRVYPKHAVDVVKAVAWRERRLIFEEETLQSISAEFNRYNRAPQVRIEDDIAKSARFSGTFNADAPEALLQALDGDPSVVAAWVDGDIVVRRRERARP